MHTPPPFVLILKYFSLYVAVKLVLKKTTKLACLVWSGLQLPDSFLVFPFRCCKLQIINDASSNLATTNFSNSLLSALADAVFWMVKRGPSNRGPVLRDPCSMLFCLFVCHQPIILIGGASATQFNAQYRLNTLNTVYTWEHLLHTIINYISGIYTNYLESS